MNFVTTVLASAIGTYVAIGIPTLVAVVITLVKRAKIKKKLTNFMKGITNK